MIHQLRIYEIFERNKAAFHERFRDHAARIMRSYGFDIVAMWEAQSDGRTEFVYLLGWPDEPTMQSAWARFRADDEWKEIKRVTNAQHGDLVGAIEDRLLVPTSYSRPELLMASQLSTRFVNPPALSRPFGYTHVVETGGGRTVYISGQVALDTAGNVVGADDLHVQATQVFKNLDAALAAAGASFHQVVKLTYFLIDISQIGVVRAVRDRYVNTRQPPASSAVEVRRLFRDELLIEVEAIAVVPDHS